MLANMQQIIVKSLYLRKKRKKNQQNWQKEKEKRDWFLKLSKGGLSRIWSIKKYYLHIVKVEIF
jgi:hypothetical protein